MENSCAEANSFQRSEPKFPPGRDSSSNKEKSELKISENKVYSSDQKKLESKVPLYQVSSSDKEKLESKLRQSRVSPTDKENINMGCNNNAYLPSNPDDNEDANEANFQDSGSACVNNDVPVVVREEAVHDNDHLETVEESSLHTVSDRGAVRQHDAEDNQSNKRCRLSLEIGGTNAGGVSQEDTKSSSSQTSLIRKLLVKEENVCDEPPVYNDIAMDPSLSDHHNVVAKGFRNTDGNLTQALTDNSSANKDHHMIKMTSHARQSLNENYKTANYNASSIVVVDKIKSSAFLEDENSSEPTLQVDENRSESALLIDEENNYKTKLEVNKLSCSIPKLEETVLVKNGLPNGKGAKVTVELVPSCNMDATQCKEQNQTEIYHRDSHLTDGNIRDNVSIAVEEKCVKPMMLAKAVASSRNVSANGQQVPCGPSSNKHLQSEDVMKDSSRYCQQSTFRGNVRQPGESILVGSDHNNNRLVKSEGVISQFNLFPTEKDVMAAVYQNTAETSHLTSGCGLNNNLSHSTSVVSTHSGYGSFLAGDLQTSSGFPETQGSHSKWFANQVNLAAALCVANNNSYQDVHISSPLVPQRSPQQRNVFSPSGQKDFSQFVLQSPKANIQSHQNISPSMLCSPSTNLFDSLMYQSENPFSPSGSRPDTGRNYSNVQDLDELMSAQQLQQPVQSFQQRQQQQQQQQQQGCYMNNSAHSTSQQTNRSQDLNWNNMNQSNRLPGVASLLPSVPCSTHNAEGRPANNIVLSNNSNGAHTIYVRDRFQNNGTLPSMGIENVRPQKERRSLLPCNNNNVIMEEYTAAEYQEMLQRSETVQGQGNRNWNAAPQEEQEGAGNSNRHKSRPRKQNMLSESTSSPHLTTKQPSTKGTKRSHSNTENTSSPAPKKTAHTSNEEESKGYVNYQIASTIHTLKPRHIVSWYIDYLIKQNESITDMSHSYSIPAGIFDDRDFYFMESLVKRMTFPTKKFANWMQDYFPSININAIDFREGRRRPPIIMDEAKYWSERTQVDIINEVFYHFQSVRDQK